MTRMYFANNIMVETAHDDQPEHPRNHDGSICALHFWPKVARKYASLRDEPRQGTADDFILFPLYMYLHSDVAFSTFDFNDPYDSWQAGSVFVYKQRVREKFGWKRITKQRMGLIRLAVHNELSELADFCNGYTYLLYVYKNHELFDIVTGFYGESAAINWACDAYSTQEDQ